MTRSSHLRLIRSSATPEEAAAVVAAIERFMRATAPTVRAAPPAGLDGWRRAALLDGVEREPVAVLRTPWINT